ncbi:MAG: UDP-N-acetylglucosamine--N-acetylmuramyl-(pentapeptide) pyrophosphoryl-undecaprenol N-acetylglucosamine transferase [Chloroflexi bacterium]|nr:UDP-N-acetylglucosamine--N-acetylmuramyl-(pentapeptide) pyrophosphoryl-undecaprenol N-acetylglucosamine transferase [Chloroflexota bacterium]
MRIALAGGGTGGHVYPAIAVAERLRERPGMELSYYGTEYGVEREIAAREGIPFRAVPAAQVRVRRPVAMAKGILRLWQGTRAARRMLQAERPGAVFATGGYAAAPVGRAAKQAGIPLVVFLPDATPGWAVRFLAQYADTVACAVDAAVDQLPAGKAIVTGYPLRGQFAVATRNEGIARFGLDSSLPTVLVAGGSLGARSLNDATAMALPQWLDAAQVLHLCGRGNEGRLAAVRSALPDNLSERYHLHEYTEEMAYAMAAADVAVMRAGASTLGELSATGLPVVAVPGAFSDQAANAEYLARRGAGIHLPEARIGELAALVSGLLADSTRRDAMRDQMRALARPDAAEHLASLVIDLAERREAAA